MDVEGPSAMTSANTKKTDGKKITDDAYKDLVLKLQSRKLSDVYNALVEIKKKYAKNHEKMKKLEKFSVIKMIVLYLEHPKYSSISLSIIADACLDRALISEVVKNDGVKCLIRIVKSSVNDEIKNRACRALGNIAQTKTGYHSVHHFKPVPNIVEFLGGTENVNCQQTAVRTLRILGKNAKSRDLITRENGILSIAKLLYSSDESLLFCSIRALAELTENCNSGCARQLLELESLQIFVQLHTHSEKRVRDQALICLKNIACQEEIRYRLIKLGAVNLFTEVAVGCESVYTSRVAALALCSCLDHSHMWENNGTTKVAGLRALMAVLQSENHRDIHFQIIASLYPLSYELENAEILLDLKVIPVLIQILKSFTDDNRTEHPFRYLPGDENSENVGSSNKSRDLIPSPAADGDERLMFDPCEELRGGLISEFPVDCEMDCEESKIMAENRLRSESFNNEMTPNIATDFYILSLLLQVSYHFEKENNSELASKSCFTALLDYLDFIESPNRKAETLLVNLMKNRYIFEKLVTNGFITEIEERMLALCGKGSCSRCLLIEKFHERLLKAGRKEAESDYGIGTLRRMLLNPLKSIQIHVIYAASKLLTGRACLQTFFIQDKGLTILFDFLSSRCEKIRRQSILALCELYQSLKNTTTKRGSNCCISSSCEFKPSVECSYREGPLDVTFSVDDGIKISASREKICKNSEYFSALLSGHYCETTKTVIPLRNISAETLTVLLHFLHGCGAGGCCCPHIEKISFQLLLELLQECDRLLLTNPKAFVEDRLCHSLSPNTISKIYLRAKMCNSPALTKKAMHFALTQDTPLSYLQELLTRDCFLDDIKELLTDILHEHDS